MPNELKTIDVAPLPMTPNDMLAIAVRDKFDVATIKELVALKEHMEDREASKQLWSALSKAQGEFPPIAKTRYVDYKYKYASLDDLMAQCSGVLAANGLALTFSPGVHDDNGSKTVSASVVLHHASGASHTFPPVVMPIEIRFSKAGNPMVSGQQAVGVAMTYANRYAYMGALGIRPCDEDTDGRTTYVETPPEPAPPPPPPEPPAGEAGRDTANALSRLFATAEFPTGAYTKVLARLGGSLAPDDLIKLSMKKLEGAHAYLLSIQPQPDPNPEPAPDPATESQETEIMQP